MLMMTRSWIPDPIPTPDGMDDQGYEAWVWAAGHRPRWLASLPDPQRHFRMLAERINEEMDSRACQVLGIEAAPPEPTGDPTPQWDRYVDALVEVEPLVMADLAFQDPETSEPVWVEGVVDHFNPDSLTDESMQRWWETVEDQESLDEVSGMVSDLDPKRAAELLAARWPELEDLDSPE